MDTQADRAAWNRPRYRASSRGMYEVWYATAVDPVSQLGIWVRYTIGVSKSRKGQGGVWLAAFDRKHPGGNFARRQMHPLSEVQVGPTGVAVAETSVFDGHRMVGELTDGGCRCSWDLLLEPRDAPTPMLPEGAYRSALIQTKVVGVTLDARLSGTMTIDGQTWDFDDIPAAQSHLWGSRHAEAWSWVHCNAFETEGVVFAGFVARVRRLGLVSPPLTQLTLRLGEREHRLVGWWRALSNRNEVADGPVWQFEGSGDGVSVVADVACRAEDLVRVDYRDPDGSEVICHNTEVATLRLQVRPEGQGHYDSHVAEGRAAFEYGRRQRAGA